MPKKMKIIKIFTSLFLAVIILVNSSVVIFADNSPTLPNQPTTVLGESGKSSTKPQADQTEQVEEETVLISTEAELKEFAQKVNSGDSFSNVTVELERDIELTENWTPIGNRVGNPFSGTFNGNNYAISGIKVTDGEKGGLFGFLYEATIKNLKIHRPTATESTGGLYFLATRTSITEVSYQISQVSPPIAVMRSPFSTEGVWSGGLTGVNPYPPASTPVVGKTYVINDANQLAHLAAAVNSGQTFSGATVILAVNINLDNHEWTPIGMRDEYDNEYPFMGDFDGQGHYISNLKSTKAKGLFE